MDPNDKVFIRLIARLAEPSALPNPWEPATDSNAVRAAALRSLSLLRTSDLTKFFSVLSTAAPPHETVDAFRTRAHEIAKSMLPRLLREFQKQVAKEASETTRDQFLRNEAAFDPFLENANLSRDAYSGRGEVEPEQPLLLDHWGNVRT